MCAIVKEEIVFDEIEVEEHHDLNDFIKQEIKQEEDLKGVEGTHKCDQCSKALKTRSQLISHIVQVHNKGKKIKCDECDKLFKKARDLSVHKKFMHATERPFQCELCPKSFVTSRLLKSHFRVHSAIRPYIIKCDECDKLFKKTTDVAVHKKFVHATERPFQCEVCPRSFATAGFLRSHARIHSVTRPYKCDQCSKDFKKQSQLSCHVLQMHSGKKIKCDECDKLFKKARDLSIHKKFMHATERPFQCEACPKSFVTARLLKSHSRGHSANKPYNIKCDECDKIFKNTEYLSAHKVNVHATERRFQCEKCPKCFPTAKILRKHLKNHIVDTPYKCEQCSEAFSRPYALAKHKAKEHGNGGDFPCGVCDKRFLFSNSLKVHQLLHSDQGGEGLKLITEPEDYSNEKNIKCDECDKLFKSAGTLTAHKVNAHATEKPFQCGECPKSFATVRNLKAHLRNHIVDTPYKCDQCSEAFNRPYALAKHKAQEHGTGGDFPCDVCGKRFLFSNSLKVHRLSHTNEYNIQCDLCDKKFKRKNDLHGHKKQVHATERTFQCKSCPKSFAKATLLKVHSRSHGVEQLHKCDRCSEAFNTPHAFAMHKAYEHGNNIDLLCDSETLKDVNVKEELVELYDPEANQVVSELKREIEEETDLIVKQEPEEIDEGL